MMHAGWHSLDSADVRPRYFDADDEGWYRFAMVSPTFGTPVGKRKLMQLRSRDPATRRAAAAKFAQHVAEFLPAMAVVTYMPSSTRRTATSEPGSVSSLFLNALASIAPTVRVVEPVIRASPVPSVAETRIRSVELLTSTLEVVSGIELAPTLYVLDEMVSSGATFAAFVTAFRATYRDVRPALIAWVR